MGLTFPYNNALLYLKLIEMVKIAMFCMKEIVNYDDKSDFDKFGALSLC